MKKIMKLLILFFLFSFLFSFASWGQEEENSSSSGCENCGEKNQLYEEQIKHLKQELEKNKASGQGYDAYKPNYFLPYTYSDYQEGRLKEEAKFQISTKQKLYAYEGYSFYIAYSQKSLWQVYDEADSRPFRETNFNPSTFVRLAPFAIGGWGDLQGDLGFEHESNGEILPASRSWNRIYATFSLDYEQLSMDLKTWYRLPEDPKKYENDPEGDENPDIAQYYGYGELYLKYTYEEISLGMMGRLNPVTQYGALQIDLTVPTPLFESSYLYFQYWKGYGESLIDYNRSIVKYGIGFMSTR